MGWTPNGNPCHRYPRPRLVLQVITTLKKAKGYRFAPLTVPIVLQIQAAAALPDLHDRFIVATALHLGATLITQDKQITQSGVIPVSW